jgi:uncharacterized membrane protein
MNYARAAAIGAVTGLRSMTGPALVAEAANAKSLKLRNTPVGWLGSDNAARTTAILAVGEMIADKIPGMPNRTDAPALAFRALAGAVCGYSIAGRVASNQERWISAAVGAGAALAAAWIGVQYRKRVGLPPVMAALAEDAVALWAGSAAIASIGR